MSAAYDFQIPLMSLPHALRMRDYQIPWDGPYLSADSAHIEKWKRDKSKPAIGVCWAGGARNYNAQNHEIDGRRSLKFEQIKPLLDIPGIDFVSLMAEKNADFYNEGLKSFSDTAGVIHHLDGVISVDTAVANLAGAMAKPTWVLSRFDQCWRWCKDLKKPWYPTVTVLRQTTPGDWSGPLDAIRSDLGVISRKIAA
jgi:hypothetical protein